MLIVVFVNVQVHFSEWRWRQRWKETDQPKNCLSFEGVLPMNLRESSVYGYSRRGWSAAALLIYWPYFCQSLYLVIKTLFLLSPLFPVFFSEWFQFWEERLDECLCRRITSRISAGKRLILGFGEFAWYVYLNNYKKEDSPFSLLLL